MTDNRCRHRVGYSRPETAQQALRWHAGTWLRVYHCPECSFWHIGQ